MASGVAIDDEVKKEYESIKLRKNCKYLLIGLSDDLKQIQILKKGKKEANAWENFQADLMEAEEKKQCRYAVYDYQYQKDDGSSNSKLVLFSWSPGLASVKQRMVYASSKQYLKSCLASGYSLDKECFEMSDLDVEALDKELSKK